MELKEVLPASVWEGLEEILNRVKWERRAFVHALALGNALISQADTDSYTRYLLHQEFNRRFSERRAEKLREEASVFASPEVILGFFHHGEAEEVSLFSGYPEKAGELFRGNGTSLPPDLIIGYGCKDLSVTVVATFDTSVDHDWGWEDSLGEHVEYYDAASRTFYRRSMSGRTCYRLLIDDNGIAIPQGRVYPWEVKSRHIPVLTKSPVTPGRNILLL